MCDEHLYLPATSGRTLPYTFRIGKLGNGYGLLDPAKNEEKFAFFQVQKFSFYGYSYFARPETGEENWRNVWLYTNVQRFDKFCTTELRKWEQPIGEKDAY